MLFAVVLLLSLCVSLVLFVVGVSVQYSTASWGFVQCVESERDCVWCSLWLQVTSEWQVSGKHLIGQEAAIDCAVGVFARATSSAWV